MNFHQASLKTNLKYLLNNENYWNVMMFCKDGTMALNRLTAGLLFPQIQDEISIICPDYSMQEITDQINQLLFIDENELTLCDNFEKNDSESIDRTQNHVSSMSDDRFNEDLYLSDTSSEPDNLDVSFEVEDNTIEVPLVGTLFSETSPLAENSKEPKEISENININGDSNFGLETLDNEMKDWNVGMIRSDSPVFIVRDLLNSLMYSVIDHSCPSTSNVPHCSNLIFSTLGSFGHADAEVENNSEFEISNVRSQVDFHSSSSPKKSSNQKFVDDPSSGFESSLEYIEEKPDISNIPFILDERRFTCSVRLERLSLKPSDWEDIHYYLEQADELYPENKLKAKFKTCIGTKIDTDFENELKVYKGLKMKPKRTRRCFKCEACVKPDCRKCVNCKDMKKYGGKGTKKQSCIERTKCLEYSQSEFKTKYYEDFLEGQRHTFKNNAVSKITLEKARRDFDSTTHSFLKNLKEKRKKLLRKERSDPENDEKKRKVREIKEKFRKQEAALKAGKNPLPTEELLFGFHL